MLKPNWISYYHTKDLLPLLIWRSRIILFDHIFLIRFWTCQCCSTSTGRSYFTFNRVMNVPLPFTFESIFKFFTQLFNGDHKQIACFPSSFYKFLYKVRSILTQVREKLLTSCKFVPKLIGHITHSSRPLWIYLFDFVHMNIVLSFIETVLYIDLVGRISRDSWHIGFFTIQN